jgi:hypothetical protein
MSYELQAMSFELSDTSYEQRDMRIKLCLRQLMMEQYTLGP